MVQKHAQLKIDNWTLEIYQQAKAYKILMKIYLANDWPKQFSLQLYQRNKFKTLRNKHKSLSI